MFRTHKNIRAAINVLKSLRTFGGYVNEGAFKGCRVSIEKNKVGFHFEFLGNTLPLLGVGFLSASTLHQILTTLQMPL